MKNIAFVLWMVGFPISMAVSNYLTYKKRGDRPFPENVQNQAVLLEFALWFFIGMKLYET